MRPTNNIKISLVVASFCLLTLVAVRAYAVEVVHEIEIIPVTEELLESGKSIKVKVRALDKQGNAVPNARILAEAEEEVVATIEPREAEADGEGYAEFTITGHDFYGRADFTFSSGYARIALRFDYEWDFEEED